MINPMRVLGDRIRRGDKTRTVSPAYTTPWWVDVLTNWGRPIVAAVVLTMCAPGEHYLAYTAGWPWRLAWGMPFVLTAYAGISAVVATKRPKGSPGKRTAVAGAILSIAVAMAAQPIAHLYQRGLISGYQTQLTIVASCIPALVLGHLLHLAVSPVPVSVPSVVPVAVLTEDRTEDSVSLRTEDRTEDTKAVPEDVPASRTGHEDVSVLVSSEDKSVPEDRDTAVPLIAKAFDVPEDILIDTSRVPEDRSPVRPEWLYGDSGVLTTEDTVSSDVYHYTPEPEPVPEDSEDSPTWSAPSGLPVSEFQGSTTDDLSSRRNLSPLIEDIRGRVGDDAAAIKSAVLATPGFEDTKRNTLNTAVRRALAKSA